MDTTESLLDQLKIKLNLRSDYALAKHLNVTGVTMLRWREGKGMSDVNALRVADLLKLPRAYVLACMHAQGAEKNTDTSGVWRQIADTFRERVSLWVIALALCFTGFLSHTAQAGDAFELRNNVYYGKSRFRALRRTFGTRLATLI